MAKKETFLLVSLNEKKAKRLAEVISNNTCRKILDHLAKGEASESEISKELDIPISTVHYNLKHLVDAKLVKADTFHYSPKGKEMLHYRLANQYVIIAPESTKHSIREKLKSIIPAATITVALGTVAQLLYRSKFNETLMMTRANLEAEAAPMAMKAAESAPMMGAVESADMAMATADLAAEAAPSVEQTTREFLISDVNVFLWFLLGAFLFLVSYLFIDYIRKRMKER